jgi:hypothetical protein
MIAKGECLCSHTSSYPYKAALEVSTREAFPVDWAMTQHNLGLAYRNLQGEDRQANVERAIACYEAAIIIFH